MDEDLRKLWLRAFVFSTFPVTLSAFTVAAHADDDDRHFNGRIDDYKLSVGYYYEGGSKMDDDVGVARISTDFPATVTCYANGMGLK